MCRPRFIWQIEGAFCSYAFMEHKQAESWLEENGWEIDPMMYNGWRRADDYECPDRARLFRIPVYWKEKHGES